MGTPQNDTSWAGWAISSFTNKMATANGEMQAKPSTSQAQSRSTDARASSLPPRGDTSQFPHSASSASTLHRKAIVGPTATARAGTATEPLFNQAQHEHDGVDDAWGDMGEESFFDAPSEINTTAPAPALSFDDGGEPDFEGWLKAQAQAKSKLQLPKGLSKQSTSGTGGRSVAASSRSNTVSAPAKQSSITTPAKGGGVTLKSIDTQPKDAGGEDEWGEAWD
jgi:SCY1-like protein 1